MSLLDALHQEVEEIQSSRYRLVEPRDGAVLGTIFHQYMAAAIQISLEEYRDVVRNIFLLMNDCHLRSSRSDASVKEVIAVLGYIMEVCKLTYNSFLD